MADETPLPGLDARAPAAGEQTAALLARRQQLTDALADAPYDCVRYLQRAAVHADLAYPDLAAGDAYRALLLTDEARDESFEYHEPAAAALAAYEGGEGGEVPEVLAGDLEGGLLAAAAVRSVQLLAASLLRCGCLRSALRFCERGQAAAPADAGLRALRRRIDAQARDHLRPRLVDRAQAGTDFSFAAADLPDRGRVRREVYPWNAHEPADRCAPAALAALNAALARAAPKCEVRATELPVLGLGGATGGGTSRQLGLFAREAIAPGEAVLREYSLLTANNRLKEAACDACGSALPEDAADAAAAAAVVACPDCADTVFCDAFCRDQALARYHPAVCDKDVDAIAKDPHDARDADDALYVLLLARLLAMATHQDCHPLDVADVQYLWGDFVQSASSASSVPPSLPFSFEANIAAPLHILEKMDCDVFAGLPLYDVWVCNTLYAKFRGTASARKSRRDGRPDVAAVHPLWCLANHSCDPNVTWEWGGRMVLWARDQRVALRTHPAAAAAAAPRPGGIAAGQEILNHYCDVELPVQQRREWASGSLGGWCMCQRCQDEAAAETEAAAEAEAPP